MQKYKHILTRGEIKDGRIYISKSAEDELMRTLGQVRDKPFNIFRSDGKLLVRTAYLQRQRRKAGLRINCGQDTFVNCTEGTPIWLRLRPDGDVEIQIGSPPGPIIDAELKEECEHILENPETENYWQAVTIACILLETRLRNQAQAPKLHGVKLVDYALNPQNGKLVCREDGGEQDGIHRLCRGVIQALRNPPSHHKPQEYSRTRARQVVGIVDYLLGEIDAAEVREGK